MERLTALVTGHVQGVGFRWWVQTQAAELGLAGSATNLSDGHVEVVAEGERKALRQFLSRLRSDPSTHGRPGRVTRVSDHWGPAEGTEGFATG
ncbi:acylphosphatase [Kineococcus rhizosphaerae]|uniref:acylphosphatase n=1 Tax=Kineococcus rhizosphaerae TaxID=559628 RepID=UPI001B80B40F|nr:acylphosphatase [Kineococcus rhizosphaerae]